MYIYYGEFICFSQSKCGTYEQLDYWANNFDDFAVSYIYNVHVPLF